MTEQTTSNGSRLKMGIIILTLATAAIHFTVGMLDPEIRVLFSLNALGYLSLLAGLYLPIPLLQNRRHWVRWALIAYAALTIGLWVVWVVMNGEATMAGIITNLIEIGLIVLLWQEGRAETS